MNDLTQKRRLVRFEQTWREGGKNYRMTSSWWMIRLEPPGANISIRFDLSLNISFSWARDSSSLSTVILLVPPELDSGWKGTCWNYIA